MSEVVSGFPLDSAQVDGYCGLDRLIWFCAGKVSGDMQKLLVVCLVVMVGCVDGRLSEQVLALTVSDGVPDPGSTWTQDPVTGWGLLVGGVNFPVPYQVGSTLRGSYIRDNADSCSSCADGNAVIMWYVVFHGGVAEALSDEIYSESDGIQRFYEVQLSRAPQPGEQLYLRLNTFFVFKPAHPRSSLVQPPILL